MDDIFDRSKGLLGETRFENLKGKTIAVLGLGGVGGTALESLARTGVENLVIVDFDVVDSSNLNRQVLHPKASLQKTLNAASEEGKKESLLKKGKSAIASVFKKER